MIEIENLPENPYGALTLKEDYLNNPEKYGGWNVVGNVHEDKFAWVNEFKATKGKKIVYGNLEDKVYAISQNAYDDFIKHCPPQAWSYVDNHLKQIYLHKIKNLPKNTLEALTLRSEYINNPEECDGWDVSGTIKVNDYVEWVNEFIAFKGDEIVYGDFEKWIFATSQKAYIDFIKHCPPRSWNYSDIAEYNDRMKSFELILIYRNRGLQ